MKALLSIGIEEELLLVETPGHRIAHDSARVLDAMGLPNDLAHPELYAACVEFATPVCADVPTAVAALSNLRCVLNASGATAIGAGTHPCAPLGNAPMLDGERYSYVSDLLGDVAMRTPECALHVHVGMPDPETALRVLNGLRAYMPLLESLAANSPYVGGVDTGLASARGVLMRRYPRFEVPRAFRDLDDYLAARRVAMLAATVDDPSLVWWRLRLHPRYGTIEVRVMDSQSSMLRVGALAALTHALAAMAAEGAAGASPPPEAIAESCYQAQRLGLEARLWDGDGVRPAREIARDVVAAARPHARALGCEDQLDDVTRIVLEGNGADRQRAVSHRGGLPAVLRHLVAETLCEATVGRSGSVSAIPNRGRAPARR